VTPGSLSPAPSGLRRLVMIRLMQASQVEPPDPSPPLLQSMLAARY
jgi:hypothetical protein